MTEPQTAFDTNQFDYYSNQKVIVMPSSCNRCFSIALVAIWFLTPPGARAFSITSVSLTPESVIMPSDDVQLVVGITTPSQDAFLFAPSILERTGNNFTADIFIDDGRILPATDFLEESLTLGMLAVGDYTYLIHLTAAYDVNFGVREVAGTFTVVPVPAALPLLLAALGSLAAMRRW